MLPATLLTDDPTASQSMIRDLEFIQQHHHKFYSQLEIESADDHEAFFWLASKRQPNRRLRLSLSAQTAFTVIEDPENKLLGRQFESFEQVMSALDEGDFGDLLCGLAAAKLAEMGAVDDAEEDNSFEDGRELREQQQITGLGGLNAGFGQVIDDEDPMAD
ncbi:unnamed protein product [Amoebophrya sp. A25]|nr:unnamed protein product [Amoebophrya sp. A25]|eukprot:GSA25T00017068001.1